MTSGTGSPCEPGQTARSKTGGEQGGKLVGDVASMKCAVVSLCRIPFFS